MMIRLVVYVMMALGLFGFGAVAWISLQPPQLAEAHAPVVQKVGILVAARDLRAGVLVKPDDIGIRQVQKDKVPEGAALDTGANRQQFTGSMVRRRVATGEELTMRDLLRPGDHGFLAAVLTAGMRAVTIGVDAITGTAGLIWPGDRVDVLLTHQIDEPNRPMGRRLASETVLSNVRVIAIDQQLVQGAAPGAAEAKPATTVTLEVTGAQSERVSVATRIGRLSLVVRAARQSEEAAETTPAPREDAAAGDQPVPPQPAPVQPAPAITWAGDVSPALSTEAVAKNVPRVVHIYRGASDGQEYRFQ
jgi:pilus assembly protein CpaB